MADAVDLIDWLTENMKAGQTVGIDGMTFSISYTQRMRQELADNDIKFNDNFPQFDYIYPERPERPKNKLFIHDEKIVGETVNSKMERLMAEVKNEFANAALLSALGDIAWYQPAHCRRHCVLSYIRGLSIYKPLPQGAFHRPRKNNGRSG